MLVDVYHLVSEHLVDVLWPALEVKYLYFVKLALFVKFCKDRRRTFRVIVGAYHLISEHLLGVIWPTLEMKYIFLLSLSLPFVSLSPLFAKIIRVKSVQDVCLSGLMYTLNSYNDSYWSSMQLVCVFTFPFTLFCHIYFTIFLF